MSPTVRYLNASIWAELRPSPVHGIGVFAIRDIPKGMLITRHTVHHQQFQICHLTLPEFDALHPAVRQLILNRTAFPAGCTDFRFPCPNCEQILQSFVNHGRPPNFYEGLTLRAVAAGEELLEDYIHLNTGQSMHPISQQHWGFLHARV